MRAPAAGAGGRPCRRSTRCGGLEAERQLPRSLPRLVVEQPCLAVEPPAVPGQGAVAADDAVAGDDDRDRVAAVGEADGTCGAGTPDASRQLAVADPLTEGDAHQLVPDAALEGRSLQREGQV